jgi:hypothetical protein
MVACRGEGLLMENPSQVQTILWEIVNELQDYVSVNDKTETDLDLAITVKNLMLRLKKDADAEIERLEDALDEEQRSHLFTSRLGWD